MTYLNARQERNKRIPNPNLCHSKLYKRQKSKRKTRRGRSQQLPKAKVTVETPAIKSARDRTQGSYDGARALNLIYMQMVESTTQSGQRSSDFGQRYSSRSPWEDHMVCLISNTRFGIPLFLVSLYLVEIIFFILIILKQSATFFK